MTVHALVLRPDTDTDAVKAAVITPDSSGSHLRSLYAALDVSLVDVIRQPTKSTVGSMTKAV